MKIKELCEAERPREKMLAMGPTALTNGELLAILIGNGTKGSSAVDVGQKLLSACEGKLPVLFNKTPEQLGKIPGIGPCKAASLMAAMELGKRYLQEKSFIGKRIITSSREVYDLMVPILKGLDHEECWVLYLNGHNYLTGKEMVSKGGAGSTVMDCAQVARKALEKGAAGIILVHNHPSGSPLPSKADTARTKSLHDALNALEICLVDHVIVADDCHYSFSEDSKVI